MQVARIIFMSSITRQAFSAPSFPLRDILPPLVRHFAAHGEREA
jgi:hypothetical protein